MCAIPHGMLHGVQMGGGNMMMNSGMIPIGAHGPAGASPMVPVGGMPQNSRHMNPGMPVDYAGVVQARSERTVCAAGIVSV